MEPELKTLRAVAGRVNRRLDAVLTAGFLFAEDFLLRGNERHRWHKQSVLKVYNRGFERAKNRDVKGVTEALQRAE